MKYAYIIGSNAFVVPGRAISYSDGGEFKEFLRINEIHHSASPHKDQTFLDCDINISDVDGTPITVIANKQVNASTYRLSAENDSIMIARPDGSVLLPIH